MFLSGLFYRTVARKHTDVLFTIMYVTKRQIFVDELIVAVLV